MLALGFMGWMLSLGIIAISVLLIGIILLQKNKGSGLSGGLWRGWRSLGVRYENGRFPDLVYGRAGGVIPVDVHRGEFRLRAVYTSTDGGKRTVDRRRG